MKTAGFNQPLYMETHMMITDPGLFLDEFSPMTKGNSCVLE